VRSQSDCIMNVRFDDEYRKIELCLQQAQEELGNAMHRLAEDMGNNFGFWSPPMPAAPPPMRAFSDPYLTQRNAFPFHHHPPPPPPLPTPQEWLKPLDLGSFGSDLFPGLPDLGIGFSPSFGFGFSNSASNTPHTVHTATDDEENGNNTLPRIRKRVPLSNVNVNDGRRASDIGPPGYNPVEYGGQQTHWKQDHYFQPIPSSPTSSTASTSSFSWQQPRREVSASNSEISNRELSAFREVPKKEYSTSSSGESEITKHLPKRKSRSSGSIHSNKSEKIQPEYVSTSESERPRSDDFSGPSSSQQQSPWQPSQSETPNFSVPLSSSQEPLPWQPSQSEAPKTPRFPVPPPYTECLRQSDEGSSASEMQQDAVVVAPELPVRSESLWTPPGGRVWPSQQRDVEKWWSGRPVPGSGSSKDESGRRPVKGRHREQLPRLVIPPPPPVLDKHELGPPEGRKAATKCPPDLGSLQSKQAQSSQRAASNKVIQDMKRISKKPQVNKTLVTPSNHNKTGPPPGGQGVREKKAPGDKDNRGMARPDLLPTTEKCTPQYASINNTPNNRYGLANQFSEKYAVVKNLDRTKNLKNVANKEITKRSTP
jgi:hypothetical protein